MHISHNICPYEQYYCTQAGSGIGVIYKGIPFQRGHGIGAFLGGLFRSVLPLLSSGAKAIGKEALRSGAGVLSDILTTSKPLEETVKGRFKEATANLKRKADQKMDDVMSGSGYKRKRITLKPITLKGTEIKKSGKKSNKKKNLNNYLLKDIFSN